jgi:hypothetical protein
MWIQRNAAVPVGYQSHGLGRAKLNTSEGQLKAREKGIMNLSERELVETDEMNVVSLFGKMSDEQITSDPLTELMNESQIDESLGPAPVLEVRRVVSQNQFPEQAMYILEEQLQSLKSSLNRMKYYLAEVDDLLPR